MLRDELAAHREEAEGLNTLFMLEMSALMDKVTSSERRLAEAAGVHKKAAG